MPIHVRSPLIPTSYSLGSAMHAKPSPPRKVVDAAGDVEPGAGRWR